MVAPVTYTASLYTESPKSLHVGVTRVLFRRPLGVFHATKSTSVLLAKLPPNCTIVDSFLKMADQTATVTAVRYVLQAGDTDVGATVSANGVYRGDDIVRVSLSDDATTRYANLRLFCTTAGTVTTTHSFSGWVDVLNDGQQ